VNTSISRLIALGVTMAALAVGIGACGSSSDSSSSSTEASTPTATSGSSSAGLPKPVKDAPVNVDNNADLGQILVAGNGMTLYLFEADTGTDSTCFDACAAEWPPYLTDGQPEAGSGADSSLIGTTTRQDGSQKSTQVTYNGHPLYFYDGDSQPGDTNGNNLDLYGAEWYALTPQGENAEGTSTSSEDSSSSTTEDTSSSGGYGY
jgi:predicted lipoprotein with Yx(FWY)xxD motif